MLLLLAKAVRGLNDMESMVCSSSNNKVTAYPSTATKA
jgi:hypothetical protein